MQLHNSGVPLKSIRATIEGRYRSTFPTMTPTPPITGK
jgi:hypothetical protein